MENEQISVYCHYCKKYLDVDENGNFECIHRKGNISMFFAHPQS